MAKIKEKAMEAQQVADRDETVAKPRDYKTVVESLDEHDFKKEPALECKFLYETTMGEDSDKPFQAYIVQDLNSGQKKWISLSYNIEKAIKKLIADKTDFEMTAILINFEGKTEINGKPFNKFTVAAAAL